jgi:hypothetical protein
MRLVLGLVLALACITPADADLKVLVSSAPTCGGLAWPDDPAKNPRYLVVGRGELGELEETAIKLDSGCNHTIRRVEVFEQGTLNCVVFVWEPVEGCDPDNPPN